MSDRGNVSVAASDGQRSHPNQSTDRRSLVETHFTRAERTLSRESANNNSAHFAGAAVSTRALTLTQHRRRRNGAPTMTLYVRAGRGADGSDGESVSSRRAPRGADGSDGGSDGNAAGGAADGPGGDWLRVALEGGAHVTRAVRGVLPEVVHPAQRRRGSTTAIIFAFFLTVFAFLLHTAGGQLRWMADVMGHDNQQGLIVAASLTDALLDKASEAQELMRPFRRTPPAIVEKAVEGVRELTKLRDASVRRLHRRMGYNGPMDDVRFLIDEHIAYEANLARLVREELEWIDARKEEYVAAAKPAAKEAKSETHTQTNPAAGSPGTGVKNMKGPQVSMGSTKGGYSNGGGRGNVPLERRGTFLQRFVPWLRDPVVASFLFFLLIIVYVRME